MIYLTIEALRGLWNFIDAHFSMIDTVKGHTYINEPIAFLLEDSQIKETIEPYFMARIVDVANFLKKFPFERGGQPFHFIVNDPIASWNNGIFSLVFNENEDTLITNKPVGNSVILDIQTLSTMMMSYRRPKYLYKII